MGKTKQNLVEIFPQFFVDIPPPHRGIKKISRRLNQLFQLLFSPKFASDETIFQATSERYDRPEEMAYYRRLASYGLFEEEKRVLKKAVVELPVSAKVLVFGCGTGREAFALEKAGHELTAIDFSPQMISAALDEKNKTESSVKFFCGDLSVLSSDQKYDLIWITYTLLNHIPGKKNRINLLRKLSSHLTGEGLMITSADIEPLQKLLRLNLASWLLRFRWWGSDRWEKGDTVKSNLGPYTASDYLIFLHYFPDEMTLFSEFKEAGLGCQKNDHSLLLKKV